MWGSAARTLVVVAAVGTAMVSPASAAPVVHSSWHVHQDALGSQPAVDHASEPSDGGGLHVAGTSRNVHLDVVGDEETWSADFSAPAGRHLYAGETFDVARSDAVGASSGPGLLVLSHGSHCGLTDQDRRYEERWLSIGSFTVQQASYDSDDQVLGFAVTFEQNCQDTAQPSIEGSAAVDVADPAVAVPSPSPTPGPITGVQVTNSTVVSHPTSNMTNVTWRNPTDPAWSETSIGAVNWEPVPTAVGGPDEIYRGRGSKLSYWTDQISPRFTFRLTPVSAAGRVGPTSVIHVTGTRLPFAIHAERVTMGQQAVLGGRLLESVDYTDPVDGPLSGSGLVGRTIDVYSQPQGGPQDDWRFLKRVTTAAGGRFSVVDTPDANTWYTAVFRGTPVHQGNSATLKAVALVAPQTDLASARSVVRQRSKIRFSTSRSTAGSRSVVQLQRHNGRSWQTVATRRLQQAKGSRVAKRLVIAFRASTRGTNAFRLVKPGDARHVTGYSRTVTVKVR